MSRLSKFDHRMTLRIQHLPKFFKPLLSGISFLGEPTVVLSIGAVGLVSAVERHQDNAKKAFILAAIAYGINTFLKLALRRRRPHNLEMTTLGVRSYSFPSGHAFGTVIIYGLFAYLDYNVITKPLNLLVAALLWLVIFLVGLSRVYMGAHYPSDVVGGWILGGLSLAIIIALAF